LDSKIITAIISAIAVIAAALITGLPQYLDTQTSTETVAEPPTETVTEPPTEPPTETVTEPPTETVTEPPTETSTTPLLSDLFVSEFSLDPSTPVQGRPVYVRVVVDNQGNEKSGAFTVQWWAGENFKKPACT
jgi:hypothetical protein